MDNTDKTLITRNAENRNFNFFNVGIDDLTMIFYSLPKYHPFRTMIRKAIIDSLSDQDINQES